MSKPFKRDFGCHEVQNIGAVQTYQRRYLYTTALAIVESDALDATTAKEEPKPKNLLGAEIDYKEDLQGAQFVIKNPNATSTCGCGSSFSA